jgi:hypothetical protein
LKQRIVKVKNTEVWAFVAHGQPSLLGAGTETAAHELCGIMNRHRTLSPWTVQPVNASEIFDEPFNIAAEIKRSYASMRQRGPLDNHPAHARPVPAEQDRINRLTDFIK